ncbi:MAG TPA: JAB domain-containing protein, partial [Herpetosiphonaceae bacterium]
MSRPTSADARLLRQALKPYVSVRQLRRLAAQGSIELIAGMMEDQPPPELVALLDLLTVLLRPLPREQIHGPEDVAALMMVRMAALPQEQLHVICLDTSNYLQAIEMIYQGTHMRAEIRPSEVFREAS